MWGCPSTNPSHPGGPVAQERTFPKVAHEAAFKGEKRVYWLIRQLTLQGLATLSTRLSGCGGTVSFSKERGYMLCTLSSQVRMDTWAGWWLRFSSHRG